MYYKLGKIDHCSSELRLSEFGVAVGAKFDSHHFDVIYFFEAPDVEVDSDDGGSICGVDPQGSHPGVVNFLRQNTVEKTLLLLPAIVLQNKMTLMFLSNK